MALRFEALASLITPDFEIGELETKLGFKFSNRDLLRQALTHESFVNERAAETAGNRIRSYERLEYLGDAVLNFTVANALFESSEDATEGEMSIGRANIVCKDSLASAAERIGLGEHILRSRGETTHSPNVQKSVLEDSFEAIIGAIHVDQGYDAAQEFVFKHLGERIDHVAQNGVDKDPKSAFQELVQGIGLKTPRYRTEKVGFDAYGQQQYSAQVLIDGREVASGLGFSKSKAQKNAAKKAQARFADGVPKEFTEIKNKRTINQMTEVNGLSHVGDVSARALATKGVRRIRSWLSLVVFRKSGETSGRHLIYRRPE